jgi:opacity protein-like surface antigen
MSYRIVLVLAVCFSTRFELLGQEQTAAASGGGQLSSIYGSLLYQSTSDFPLTVNTSIFTPDLTAFKSSSSAVGFAVGYGTTAFSSRQGYLGLELGFLRTSFSDPNITDKPFYFFDLLLDFGISPWADGRSAFYGILGGGLVYHSDESEEMGGVFPAFGSATPTTPPNYCLEKHVGAVMWGLGARFNPVSNFIVSIEYKWMYNSQEEANMNAPVPGQPGWYYTSPSFDPIGTRFSVGISYIIYSEHP